MDEPAGAFRRATAVTPAAPGRYTGAIAPGWDIGGNANGGYLLSIAARALVAATGRPDPVTVTAHYLAPGKVGPIEVDTTIVKAGRRFTTASAILGTEGRPLVAVLGTFGDVGSTTGPELVTGRPPDLPPLEECVPIGPAGGFSPEFMGRVELRIHPDDTAFMGTPGDGEARLRGWFRLRDGEELDTIGLLTAVDAFPPTAFNARLPRAWTPTVELTAHVRACPQSGWVRCAFTTRFVTGGFLEEDGEIWDGSDRLVGQSRQLALVPLG